VKGQKTEVRRFGRKKSGNQFCNLKTVSFEREGRGRHIRWALKLGKKQEATCGQTSGLIGGGIGFTSTPGRGKEKKEYP